MTRRQSVRISVKSNECERYKALVGTMPVFRLKIKILEFAEAIAKVNYSRELDI